MSDRYLQAKAIALEALERPPAERAAWLDAHCAGDAALRAEVDWLLAAADTSSDAPLLPGWDAPGDAAPLAEGARIDAAQPGQYRILRLLGEGGMGVVYLAERGDGDTHQTVALKLLGGTFAHSARMAARMAGERRILAALQHPNIAHLVDGGVTADDQPFIAMEYVEGERIDRWCDAHELPLRARVDLFLKVCAAVEHAHQRLVIHRDLKPANILVTAEGEPKLLDFGIARLLEDTDAGADPTRTAQRALTLAYASPEHIEGRPLSTATDVWSLGVVLYELLAGVRPHQAMEAGHLLPGAIVSGEIRPPSASRRTDAQVQATAKSVGRIPADLDAIVLKALRTDPTQRYPSVAALADDLRRFLQSRPVAARRGHTLYRLRRFAWRHRWKLAVGVVMLALGAGFLLDRERQLQRVTDERNKALALSGFMHDLFANADPSQARGEQITVREMLDRGARQIAARDDLPAPTRADLLLAMAGAYHGLQLSQPALPLAREALQLRRDAHAAATEIAEALGMLAELHGMQGENAEAIDLRRQAQALFDPSDTAQAADWARHRVRELRERGLMGDATPDEIIAALQELDDTLEPLGDAVPGDIRLTLLGTRADALWRDSRPQQALEVQRAAVELAQAQHAQQPAIVLTSRGNLATMLVETDTAAGVAMLEDIDRDYVRLIGPDTGRRAVALNQISVGLDKLGRKEEALDASARALDVARRALGEDNRYTLQLAVVHAFSLLHLERYREAEALLRETLPRAQARSAPGMDAVNHAYTLTGLAQTLLGARSRLQEARALFAQAEQVMAPHAAEVRVVHDSIMRGTVETCLALGDRSCARGAVARYRAALDDADEPADSRWRESLAKLETMIRT